MSKLSLGSGLEFTELYARAGLVKLDAAFLVHMGAADEGLSARLSAARAAHDDLNEKDSAQLMVEIAPHVNDFVAELFGIGSAVRELAERHDVLAPLYACKRLFVQRRAAKKVAPDGAAALDGAALEARLEALFGEPFSELAFAHAVMGWLDDEAAHEEALDLAMKFAAWALHSLVGRARFSDGVLFKLPRKLDPEHLIALETVSRHGHDMLCMPADHLRRRQQSGDLSGAAISVFRGFVPAVVRAAPA